MRSSDEPRATRWLFRVVAIVACTGVGLAAAESMTRVIDGYRLMPLRLEPIPGRTHSLESSSAGASQKWRGDADALTYGPQLPAGEGVDREWFALRPPDRPPAPPDPELAARARQYRGAELQANYEWNRDAVIAGVCRGAYRNLVAFDQFSDLYAFSAADHSEFPTFRFLQDASYPSGLRTNRFGWRSPAIEVEKPARTIRVAFVGASTTVSPHAEPYSYPELTGFWLNMWA